MESFLSFLNSTLGIIVSVLTLLGILSIPMILINKKKTSIKNSDIGSHNTINSNNTFNINQNSTTVEPDHTISDSDMKVITQILFIDDEEFEVIKMLKRMGWKNIKRRADIANLDDPDLKKADVVFVDIKGVGNDGGFKDEGLGLAAAIKKKYKNKGIIVYSGTDQHNIFDSDIHSIDARLRKNAEPIQFSDLIEQYGRKTY